LPQILLGVNECFSNNDEKMITTITKGKREDRKAAARVVASHSADYDCSSFE
jgi:hypothetical protein